MKHVLLTLVTLASTSAFAHGYHHRHHHMHDRGFATETSRPHCAPGENNVWGACFPAGYGVFNGWR